MTSTLRRASSAARSGRPVAPPLVEPILDRDVLSFDVAELAQPLPEGIDQERRPGSARGENAEPRNFARLAVDGKRRAEKNDDEGDGGPSDHPFALMRSTCCVRHAARDVKPGRLRHSASVCAVISATGASRSKGSA